MAYKLEKPFTPTERASFIIQYNHNRGLEIFETENALFALEANEIMQDNLPVFDSDYNLRQIQKEQEQINRLNLTAADVERAIYKALGLDFDDVINSVEKSKSADIDLKALKIELRANNFYRGNPYIDMVGTLLGFTKEQMDEFFKTNDYKKLVNNNNESEVLHEQ